MKGASTPDSGGPNLRLLFWLPAVLAALIVALMLAALVLVSARSLQRLTPVQAHLTHTERLHAIALQVDELLAREIEQGTQAGRSDLQRLRRSVLEAEQASPAIRADVLQRLQGLEKLLGAEDLSPGETLTRVAARLRQIQNRERALHGELVRIVADDSRLELRLALLLLFALPLATAVGFYLLRDRIKRPLDDLSNLLRHLATRDYRPVSTAQVDDSAGLVQPVYRRYNELVTRLAELEAGHRALQASLEQDVQRATAALLEQAGELARAEKLAAVGELSASLAHEIRNPLAGIQLACTKLGRQLSPEQQQKIELVVSELKRLNGLLSERLYDARHAPESLREVRVAELVGNLAALLVYQISESIRLRVGVAPDLHCALPESGLRQSLLNLVMNAVHAIGEGPGEISLFARRCEDRLEIGVSDDGPGLPPYMLEQGVRPFVTGRPDGTGLGLAIVQRFVRGLSGELRLQNDPAGGARVTLLLPCQWVTEPEAGLLDGEPKHA